MGEVGNALFEAIAVQKALDEQNSKRNVGKWLKVGAAAIIGGVAVALTAGLAAPIIMAGGGAMVAALGNIGLMGAAGAAGWTAVIGFTGSTAGIIVFGAGGAGLAAHKMSSRERDLGDFEVVPVYESTVDVTSRAEVDANHKRIIRRMDSQISVQSMTTGTLQHDVVIEPGTFSSRRGSALAAGGHPVNKKAAKNIQGKDVVVYESTRQVNKVEAALHLVIFVSGWVARKDDFVKPWQTVAEKCFPSSGHLAVKWEKALLQQLCHVFAGLVATQVISSAASWWFKGAAMAGGMAAGAATWFVFAPVTVITTITSLDNVWTVSLKKAMMAGQALAHSLADRKQVGMRPVTLIGHSMGARMIFYCMLTLHDMGCYNVVDDVVFLGIPETTDLGVWKKVRAAASGRVVNGYLPSDFLLGVLYRYMEWGIGVAGLSPVLVPGIENINLDDLGIEGHGDYALKYEAIFARIRLGQRHPVDELGLEKSTAEKVHY